MKGEEDEGGTLALQMSEDISNQKWADIMQEEYSATLAATLTESPEREPSPLPGPPYVVQVSCTGATDEEIFFLFGGESTIKWMSITDGKGKVEIHDEDSMRRVLALDGESIKDETLKVEAFDIRSSNDVRMVGGISGGARQYQRYQDTRHDQQGYHRGGHRQDNREYNRGGYHPNHHERGGAHHHGGGYGGRGGHMDVGYGRGRGGGGYRGRGYGGADGYHTRGGGQYRGGYGGDMGGRYQNEGQGGMGRSNSYYGNTRDHHQPAPINRSRTESTSSYATIDRAPSRFSCDAPISPPQGSVEMATRKPSAKSIFGEAKPVDTTKKLCEVEERLAAEEKERKKEAEEKKRVEEEKRRMEEEEKKREEEERQREKAKAPHPPMQILRRPKTADSVDEGVSIEREFSTEERGDKRKEGGEQRKKQPSFKENKEREREKEGEREKSITKNVRTFSNSSRIGPKSGSIDHEEMRGGGEGGRGAPRGRGGIRGSRGRGIRGGYGGVSGRRNSGGSNIDPSIDREKEDERREKKEERKEGGERERTEKKPFNIQSRLYSDGDVSLPPPSSHSTPPPQSAPTVAKSVPAKDTVLPAPAETFDSLQKGNGEEKKKKKEEKEEVKEEKKTQPTKPPTPQKKKNKGKEKDKLKFASNNKFAALLED